MIGLSAFTVFILGLRHGADPDHLAAIDAMTRNSFERRPWMSRFAGTFFGIGHSIMVLSIAALVGMFGSRFAAQHERIEMIGTITSIVVLFIIAGINLFQLQQKNAVGLKTRLIPKALLQSPHPLIAMVVGLMFGVGFETSSQIATYALAFGAQNGVYGAIIVGILFSLGMLVTDTLDSVLVHRLINVRGTRLERAQKIVRSWMICVTVMTLAVALYETAQLLGWKSPLPDIAVSGALVGALLFIFGYLFVSTSKTTEQSGFPTVSRSLPDVL